MAKAKAPTSPGEFKMVKLPLWLYDQLSRLAELVQDNPHLYSNELQNSPDACPLCGKKKWSVSESRLYRYLQCSKCSYTQRDLRVSFGYKVTDMVALGTVMLAKRAGDKRRRRN
jgi:hypothetical protein